MKHSVDPLRHKAKITNGVLNITLYKAELVQWNQLEYDDEDISIDEIRRESLLNQEKLQNDMAEKRKDKRIEDERYATRTQMALDAAERDHLESLKAEEKATAEKAVYETFRNMQSEQERSQRTTADTSKTLKKVDEAMNQCEPKTMSSYTGATSEKFIFDDAVEIDMDLIDDQCKFEDAPDPGETREEGAFEGESSKHNSEYDEVDDNADGEVKFIPPPRSEGISRVFDGSAKVGINFTPRVFPTPLRESKVTEEEDWVARNGKHVKKHGVLGKNVSKGNEVRVEEEDPVWLKAKGDDFFRSGDVRSALNAYTTALEADPNMISCMSNRSICNLKLNDFAECKKDCEEVVRHTTEQLKGCGENEKEAQSMILMQTKAYLRRAAANSQLFLYGDAVQDYKCVLSTFTHAFTASEEAVRSCEKAKTEEERAALPETPTSSTYEALLRATKLDIGSLRSDLHHLECLCDAERLKKEADSLFAERRLEDACDKYSEALKLAPLHVGCLSNRSACKMALQDLKGCVEDCSEALFLLELNVDETQRLSLGTGQSGIDLMAPILPPAGSPKRRAWVLKTITRRGAAHAQLGELDLAVADYGTAAGLEPQNEALRQDLNKIMNMREATRLQSISPNGNERKIEISL